MTKAANRTCSQITTQRHAPDQPGNLLHLDIKRKNCAMTTTTAHICDSLTADELRAIITAAEQRLRELEQEDGATTTADAADESRAFHLGRPPIRFLMPKNGNWIRRRDDEVRFLGMRQRGGRFRGVKREV